jgi:hypothetical protein
MKLSSKLSHAESIFFLGIWLIATNAFAGIVAVSPSDFPPGTTMITFDGLPDGTDLGALVVDGVLFNYTLPVGLGGVIIDGGPGVTNHISPPNAVTYGDIADVEMILSLPAPTTMFGYGYALDTSGFLANATTIALYDGFNFIGSLSFDGDSDPGFTGGFAGVRSTVPFNTVYMLFDWNDAPAWAFDNVMIYTTPEPSSLMLLGGGLLTALGIVRRKTKR